jgi:hypothetical protein
MNAQIPDSGSLRMGGVTLLPTRMWCCAPAMHRSSPKPNTRLRTCWRECGEHNQITVKYRLTFARDDENRGSSSPGERQ